MGLQHLQQLPVSNVEAAIRYRKAAEQGDVLAQLNLGKLLTNEPESVHWFRKAAEQGHADARA